ncbi:MAG: hypothetical protein ACLFNU_10230 [Bacteroidales bacterium]
MPLINPETKKVQLSTNSKDKDKAIEDNEILNVRSLLVHEKGSIVRIINPIKGPDKTIGVISGVGKERVRISPNTVYNLMA